MKASGPYAHKVFQADASNPVILDCTLDTERQEGQGVQWRPGTKL